MLLEHARRSGERVTLTSLSRGASVWQSSAGQQCLWAVLRFRVLKLLSEDPSNYKDAPREGIRRLLEDLTGAELPRDQPVATERIAAIRMGTTVSLVMLRSMHNSSGQRLPKRIGPCSFTAAYDTPSWS